MIGRKPPIVIYREKPKLHSWCRWSVYRVRRRNNSVNVRFTGDTGTGKSWSALKYAEICAEMMGKKFSEESIYFSIGEVLKEVAEDSPPPGTIFLIDEQQVHASSKDHNTKRVKAYSTFLSTVRSKRYIIISTIPFSDMEAKQIRRFFQVEIECRGANLTTNTVRSTPRYLEYSRHKDNKIYIKRLVVKFVNNGRMKNEKLSYWDIPKPSEKLIDAYELKKARFQRDLYLKLSKELSKEEGKEEEVPKAKADEIVYQKLTEYQRAIYEIMSSGIKVQKEVSKRLRERGFTSTPPKVSQNLKWMRKKGVIILR